MKRRKSITGHKPKKAIRKTPMKAPLKQPKGSREEVFVSLDKIKRQLPVYLEVMADLVYDLLHAKCDEAMTPGQLLEHISEIRTEAGNQLRKEINNIETGMKSAIDSDNPLLGDVWWETTNDRLTSIYNMMTLENTRDRVIGYMDNIDKKK